MARGLLRAPPARFARPGLLTAGAFPADRRQPIGDGRPSAFPRPTADHRPLIGDRHELAAKEVPPYFYTPGTVAGEDDLGIELTDIDYIETGDR